MTLPAILGVPTPLRVAARRSGQVAMAAAGSRLAAFPNPLPLRVQPQGGDNWCWAAVTIGIAQLYGAAVETQQCRFVTQTFSMSPADRCCTNPPSDECDQPSSLDRALHSVGCYASGDDPVPFAAIRGEISQGRVVGVFIRRPNRSGHFMAVSGWQLGPGGEEWVKVNDPDGGRVVDMLFTTLAHSREGDWESTTFTRRPPGMSGLAAPAGPPPNGPIGG